MTWVTHYDVEVRPGPGQSFQYYEETVTAPTDNDARQKVQRRNPGSYVRTTRSYTTEEYNKKMGITNSSSSDSSSSIGVSDIPLPSFGTIIKCIGLGTVVMWGLQFVQVPNIDQPAREGTLMERIQQRNNTIIQHSQHHKDDTIPQFFNTTLQEDVVDGLGQDWDN